MQLPAWYWQVIDGEAAHLGCSRSEFLHKLVRIRLGRETSSRGPNLPPVKWEPKLVAKEGDRKVWYCDPPIKSEFDELLRALGDMPPKNWFILAVNEWLGFPPGTTWAQRVPASKTRDRR